MQRPRFHSKKANPDGDDALLDARSPCLKLKPVTKGKKEPFLMVNVEPYGGGLWHTWFDRDLSLAGRVLLRSPDGSLKHRLVRGLVTARSGPSASCDSSAALHLQV